MVNICNNKNITHAGDLPPPPVPPFTASPGVRVPLAPGSSPVQYLQLFLTTNNLSYLHVVKNTNTYAATKLESMPPSRRSLVSSWRPVSVVEMKAFIGVIINMGLVQLAQLKDYWGTHETVKLPFFRRIFSRDRFFQIFWMLHAGEIRGTSRCNKIQPLINPQRACAERVTVVVSCVCLSVCMYVCMSVRTRYSGSTRS